MAKLMSRLLNLLIVAALAAAPTAGRAASNVSDTMAKLTVAAARANESYSDAAEVFRCDFGPQWDSNYDRWPDQWTRPQHSPTYPHYIPIRIVDEPTPAKGRPLRIDMDGGAAAVFAPAFKVNTIFSYIVEAYVKTDGLVRDEAYVAITFYDAKKKPLETFTSERLRMSNDWTKVQIGPIAELAGSVDHAVIGLHVESTKRPDVHGSAWFAGVWAGRLPRMTLKSDRRDNFYVNPDLPRITCTAAG